MADMLTYEEFRELAKPFTGGRYETDMYDPDLRTAIDTSEVFFQSWIIGGKSGGNVWGEDHYTVSAEKEPDPEALYEVFEKLGLSYWTGRKIEREQKTGTYTERAYYGDFTENAYKWISVDAVYDKLVEFGMAYPREQAPRSGR